MYRFVSGSGCTGLGIISIVFGFDDRSIWTAESEPPRKSLVGYASTEVSLVRSSAEDRADLVVRLVSLLLVINLVSC